VEPYDGREIRLGGDIIVAIGGQAVASGDDLIGYLDQEYAVGDTITLRIVRDGQAQDVQLTLEARP
jgi:2-alkenal reductase